MSTTIGYSIEDAAAAAGVDAHTIEVAINTRELRARNVYGQAVLLGTDLHLWLDAMPDLMD